MQVIIDQDLNVNVLLGGYSSAGNTLLMNNADVIEGGEAGFEVGGEMDGSFDPGTQKTPILASWPFVIGISSGTLVLSIIIGILLAKRKIKKGFELYED